MKLIPGKTSKGGLHHGTLVEIEANAETEE